MSGRTWASAAFWIASGGFFFYVLQDRGTVQLKSKLEKEGRLKSYQDKEVELMMSRLKNSPSNLTEAREKTTKERLKMAEENTVYAIQPEEADVGSGDSGG